jgi:hypothetical protein
MKYIRGEETGVDIVEPREVASPWWRKYISGGNMA